MNINENIGNYRKNAEKLRGYTYKITHISAASCPKLPNLVLIDARTQFLYPVLQYANDLILLFMNIIWTLETIETSSPKGNDSHLRAIINL